MIETYVIEGIDVVLCIGMAIESSMPDNLSYFISFGTLIGFL